MREFLVIKFSSDYMEKVTRISIFDISFFFLPFIGIGVRLYVEDKSIVIVLPFFAILIKPFEKKTFNI